ncbi:MAG: sigma-54-dependent transcriptional regulator [Spirochaetia bacterium]
MMFNILLVDDEINIIEGLERAFKIKKNYHVYLAYDGNQAIEVLKKQAIDLVITDLNLPDKNGQEVLQAALKIDPAMPVILFTGYGTIENAVKAMQMGAYDFLTKPIDLTYLFSMVERALLGKNIHQKLRELLASEYKTSFRNFFGHSAVMQPVCDILSQAAPSKANVLILGESGVGKELAAEALHLLSPRKDKPLIRVHCASLSESLLESELFGHEKGAFTGASHQKKGRFELADGGDIFLDEIGEINPHIQTKLLRVIQERCFERVGGEQPIHVDIRIITATNRDLKKEVASGRFREDLYYRLNVIEVNLPPLRERYTDIPELAAHFLKEFAQENQKEITGFTPQTLSTLTNYQWPGNVRELRNCIESAVVMSKNHLIDIHDLPASIVPKVVVEEKNITLPLGLSLEKIEEEYIHATLEQVSYNKSQAAQILGISRKTLQRKLGEIHDIQEE